VLPADRNWIRFSVAWGAAGIGGVVAVRPQAVSAVFADGGQGAHHYERPLAPGTVSRLVEAVPGLAGVEQPFPSVGGRGPEQERGFATRVSERLRHKQRAVTPWDYEHLVLDQFPEIHRAKCVPAAAGEPGVVDVVVIPDIRGQVPADPFAPRVRADLLAEIQAFLADRATVGVTVRVRNAHFLPVLVRVGVSVRPGVDPGFHLSLLNGELNRHLSPWAFDEGADIVFGGRIHATSILELIDRRPYVDWAGHIRFFPGAGGRVEATAAPGGGAAGGAVARAVVADRPDAVLVGSPRHQIDLITSTIYEPERFSGINYMVVELDFQVGD
jgi:hypothetical protein